MIKREFNCPTHGHFESKFSICPMGCVDTERVFTKAPATVSRRTKNIDKTLNGIAEDYQLTDISNKNGSLAKSVSGFTPIPLPAPHPDLVNSFIQREQKLYGGTFEVARDGSIWTSGTSFQRGQAVASGQQMQHILGENRPDVQPRPIVQGSYGTVADVMKGTK